VKRPAGPARMLIRYMHVPGGDAVQPGDRAITPVALMSSRSWMSNLT